MKGMSIMQYTLEYPYERPQGCELAKAVKKLKVVGGIPSGYDTLDDTEILDSQTQQFIMPCMPWARKTTNLRLPQKGQSTKQPSREGRGQSPDSCTHMEVMEQEKVVIPDSHPHNHLAVCVAGATGA